MFEIIGIGNAIVDVLANVNEEFLKQNNMIKGNMALVDEKQSENIYSSLNKDEVTMCSGGSVANTINGVALAGVSAAFMGKIAHDEIGQIFSDDIKKSGVYFNTKQNPTPPATAKSIVCITDDAERTMNTFLGVSCNLSSDDIDESLIKNAKFLLTEGYLWDSETAKQAIIKAAKIAKENNVKVVFSLSDAFCVDRHREDFLNFIKEYTSIIFGNDAEIKALAQNQDIDAATNLVQNLCDITVITLGAKGAMAIQNNKTTIVPAKSVQNVIDTTGAGDLFSAGFLVGLCKNLEIENSLKLGTIFAGEIITHIGAKPVDNLTLLTNNFCAEN